MATSLSKITALEAAVEYLLKATAEEEHREYDPEGFHVGPREGHYFKPGEREAGGKEVEVVQAPEAEVKDNPWDLTRKEFNKKYVWHHTSFDNAFQIQREGMKKGVFGIGGNREGFPGAVTIFARRSDVEALNPSVESFGRGQALYPEGTYSPTKEWKTPLSPDKLFIVPRESEKDPYEFLVRQKPMTEEEMDADKAEREANRPKAAIGGGITGSIDLTEKVSGVDLGMKDGILYPELHRYWYHRPPPNQREGSSDGGIQSYSPSVVSRSPLGNVKSIWLSPGGPHTGKPVNLISDSQLHDSDSIMRIVDITKLDPDDFIMANDGYMQHRGDIPFDAIVDQKQATDKTSSDNLSKLLVLETVLDYFAKAAPGEKLEYLGPGEKAPSNTKIHTTPRGARGYYLSEVDRGEEEGAAPRELEPTEEREVEVVQAPEAKPELSSDVKPRKKASIAGEMTDRGIQEFPSGHPLAGMEVIREDSPKTLPFIFNEDFKISDFQDMYSTGLDDFSTRIHNILPYDIGADAGSDIPSWNSRKGLKIFVDILDASGEKVGDMLRSFRRQDGKLKVSHHMFYIDEEHRGQGIAADMNEHVEKEYEKLGVYEISLLADDTVGGYAWARQGYDFANGAEKGRMRKKFKKVVTTLHKGGRISDEEKESLIETIDYFEHSWEFASWNPFNKSHGEHLGKRILLGTSWKAMKILDKKSEGYRVGKEYFDGKRNTSTKG